MAPMTETPLRGLAPRQRMARGLSRTAAGPVDVAYGAVGVGAQAVRAGVVHLRQRYRGIQRAQATRRISARQVIAGLPQLLEEDAPRGRVRRPLVFAGVAAVVLVAGGAAVLVIRRSTRPDESSPRPPSVDAPHLP